MAVYTKVSNEDFSSILQSYDLGTFENSKEISEGIENTNYFLFTSKGKFVFTVYEKRVSKEDLPYFMGIQEELNKLGLNCPMPLKNNNGEIIGNFNGKSFTVVSIIKGAWPKSISNNEIKHAAQTLGELHSCSSKVNGLSRENKMSVQFWKDTYAKVQTQAEEKFPELKEIIPKAYEIIDKNWPKNLESGIIHADFFPDNLLIDEESDSAGVIDFYMACNDFFVYDLAIAINAWCFEKDWSFNITKASNFLHYYDEKRKLNEEELQYMPVLCVGASLRFFSTRIYDYFNRDSNALVSVKNPVEYIEKLKFHMQIKNHLEYGL